MTPDRDTPHDADLLLHPARLRIVVAFVGGGRMTAQQLAARLPGVPPATLYRHLRILVDADVLGIVGERRVRGAVERTYELQPKRALVAPPDLATATRDDLMRAFTVFVGSLLSDFASYLRNDASDPAADGVAFFATPLQLTDAEYAAFAAEFQGLLQRAMSTTPDPTSRRRTLATILAPDPGPPGDLA